MSATEPQDNSIQSVEQLLAHALAMENEAVERYEMLADQMETHNNPEVAALFRKLAEIEKLHVDNVNDLSDGHTLPHIAPWEYAWQTPESPEAPSASAEGLHYMMHPYHAIAMALEAERKGVAFYERLADQAGREDVRKIARELCETEREHVTLLQGWLGRFQPPPKGWSEDADPPLPQE
ncbi:ferritin-like domain-containing protein [Thauera aromatica]|uniref:Ferritin-like protein n=1 Tax=Thauera aromatica K172 TaxID=44139 RepID=A0A2R4BLM9_THAAR|nr:ferritin family protein [Thauera aromatica]AVR88227.1 ferritin-like protein [Thauera aromatica K172]MCK2087911.1 ferritin family protein [Thauera aromatica]MCK2094997.1 ferritin family protein [Thauera aromatica]MCK2125390.1 ferritin family protein [Thauera aromatica]